MKTGFNINGTSASEAEVSVFSGVAKAPKWIKLFVILILLLILLGIVAGLMKLMMPQLCPEWITYILAGLILFMFFCAGMALMKIPEDARRAFGDFLENNAPLPSADYMSFGPEYRKEFDEATQILKTHGMEWVTDCHLPTEEYGTISSGKPVLARIFCNSEKKLWCMVFKMSASTWGKCFPLVMANSRIIGEFTVCFENGTALNVNNIECPAHPNISRLVFQMHPEASLEELLQISLEEKLKLEKSVPAKPLSLSEFMGLWQSICVYREGLLHPGIRYPSDKQLSREGFSSKAIEKYRQLRRNPVALLFPSEEGGSK